MPNNEVRYGTSRRTGTRAAQCRQALRAQRRKLPKSPCRWYSQASCRYCAARARACSAGACGAVCGKPCGDGTCDPEAGESTDTCAEDCNACTTNLDCLRGEWCSLPIGECKGSGTCEVRPTQCPKLFAPVCGCDDKTYTNACLAAEAGVNVRSMGACD